MNSNKVSLWGSSYNIDETTQLDINNVNGEIPMELFRLKNLQFLRIRGNNLKGNILPQIGDLKNLITLDLSMNELSGPLPIEIENLKRL